MESYKSSDNFRNTLSFNDNQEGLVRLKNRKIELEVEIERVESLLSIDHADRYANEFT
jgi:hypothetical protein